MTAVPRNIVVLSDGTGNAAASIWRTNVWRLFQSLDLSDAHQVAMYDDGVGSSSFKPLALLGGAVGWGLKRNVLDLYKFVCRNHRPGARIYAFGFSRGAFTIRIVLGLIAHEGLVRYQSEAELAEKASAAYRAYRKARFASFSRVEKLFRALRDGLLTMLGHRYDRAQNLPAPPIHFVGLWDTVAAYGLPIEEMTRGVSRWLWPLELPDRVLGPAVQRACHALALDDERTTFHPVLWSEAAERPARPDADGRRWIRDERISQVWFAGSHANVGGGYPDDALAHVSLTWMMAEARRCGLRFKTAPKADPDAVVNARAAADKDGRLYDSRHGLAGYYRYGPRKIWDLCHRPPSSRREADAVRIDAPKVHESALDRVAHGAHAYAPIGLPALYDVVSAAGEILGGTANGYETREKAAARADAQERVWNVVWWRRVVYFATLGASAYLVLCPILYRTDPAREFATRLRLVSRLVRAAGAVLPAFTAWWIDAYAANPGPFVAGVAALVALMLTGVALGNTIRDRMLVIWRASLRPGVRPAPGRPDDLVYRLRTHPAYTRAHRALKLHVIPFVSAMLLLYLGAALVSHLAFDVADAAGAVCHTGGGAAPAALAPGETRSVDGFTSSSICWPTGIALEEGRRYRIVITTPGDWSHRASGVEPGGIEISHLPRLVERVRTLAMLPLRRVLDRPWFRPIARIGRTGSDEYPLDPESRQSSVAQEMQESARNVAVAELKARRTGELFVYVNDAIIGAPWVADLFYRDNHGAARVEVTRLGRR